LLWGKKAFAKRDPKRRRMHVKEGQLFRGVSQRVVMFWRRISKRGDRGLTAQHFLGLRPSR